MSNITIIGDYCRFELAKDAKVYKESKRSNQTLGLMENVSFDRGWLDQRLSPALSVLFVTLMKKKLITGLCWIMAIKLCHSDVRGEPGKPKIYIY